MDRTHHDPVKVRNFLALFHEPDHLVFFKIPYPVVVLGESQSLSGLEWILVYHLPFNGLPKYMLKAIQFPVSGRLRTGQLISGYLVLEMGLIILKINIADACQEPLLTKIYKENFN